MCLDAFDQRHKTLLQSGLIVFAIANVARYVIERHALLSASLADGASGLLFGVAIGLLGLGVYLRRNASRGSAA